MINEGAAVSGEILHVLNGVNLSDGHMNVTDDVLLANVRSAIRRPYPQIRPLGLSLDRVALVGGGPSLRETEGELIELVRQGVKLVTMNGAYQWCVERNLLPHTQIVLDARPSNARFLYPALPHCNYVLASQCAPAVWDAVAGRPKVWIFHAATGETGPLRDLLDAHYLGQWLGIGGGVTVATRAIMLLRACGYVTFELFGIDCCFLDGEHHAFAQPENERDQAFPFTVFREDGADLSREFICAPWHVKQFEDFLQLIRINGEQFRLTVHGDGMLAYALSSSAIVFDREWAANRVTAAITGGV